MAQHSEYADDVIEGHTRDDECLWRRETISMNDHLISTIYLVSYPDIL